MEKIITFGSGFSTKNIIESSRFTTKGRELHAAAKPFNGKTNPLVNRQI